MPAGLTWTDGALDHIAKHGISREEVECAIRGPFYSRRSGDVRLVIGRCAGRTLFIVLVESSVVPDTREVASARPAEPSEKRLLARRGKGIR